MKKNLLLALAALLLGAQAQAANTKPRKPKPGPKACSVELKHMKGENKSYTYDLQYPQFGSPCRSVNRKFKNFMFDTYDNFRKDYGAQENPNGQKNEIVMRYAVFCSSANLVSVRLNTYMYTGGAHGNSTIAAVNFNPGAAVTQTLERLTKGATGYALERLSELTRADLRAQLAAAGAQDTDLSWLEQGTSSAAANFDVFTLDGQGNIYIQFPQYQVAAYAYGEMQVKLPLESLRKPKDGAGIANPASVNCISQGGKLEIRKKPDGGEYGVCIFDDNRQCEEWALFRGKCPKGGVKITGYTSIEAAYCAIRGYEAVDASYGKPAACTVDGKTCPALEYYTSGNCGVK